MEGCCPNSSWNDVLLKDRSTGFTLKDGCFPWLLTEISPHRLPRLESCLPRSIYNIISLTQSIDIALASKRGIHQSRSTDQVNRVRELLTPLSKAIELNQSPISALSNRSVQVGILSVHQLHSSAKQANQRGQAIKERGILQ